MEIIVTWHQCSQRTFGRLLSNPATTLCHLPLCHTGPLEKGNTILTTTSCQTRRFSTHNFTTNKEPPYLCRKRQPSTNPSANARTKPFSPNPSHLTQTTNPRSHNRFNTIVLFLMQCCLAPRPFLGGTCGSTQQPPHVGETSQSQHNHPCSTARRSPTGESTPSSIDSLPKLPSICSLQIR